MKLSLKIQDNDSETLIDFIRENLNNNPKNVYLYFGIVKESGFNLIEDDLIDLKSNLLFVLGIDKKNTTRKMLECMLDYTKNVYVYNNNNIEEFDSSLIIFEYSTTASVISTTSNLSEGGLNSNFSTYTLAEYNLKDSTDKKDYKEFTKRLLDILKDERFVKINNDYIDKLVHNKDIFTTKQYLHNVRSISEYIENKKGSKEEKNDDLKNDIYSDVKIEIPKINLDDSSIDIEIPEDEIMQEEKIYQNINNHNDNEKSETVKNNEDNEENKDDEKDEIINSEKQEKVNNNEFYDEDIEDVNFDENDTLDIQDMLFSKADVKLKLNDKPEKKSKADKTLENESSVIKKKNIDLENVSNLFIQLDEKQEKGKEALEIKIPNYINSQIPNFFELAEKGDVVEIDGRKIKIRHIELSIVDVKNKLKYTDKKAKIEHVKSKSYVSIVSDLLKNVEYDVYDIARIIKLSSSSYHIEIVSKDVEEYRIWNKLCNNPLKSSDKSYGMM